MSISAIHCPGGPSSHWSENWGRGGVSVKIEKILAGVGVQGTGFPVPKRLFFFTPVT